MPIIEPKQRGIGPIGRLVIAASHRASYQLAKWCPRKIPGIAVLGYPRSGTVWASQMIADYLQLPYPILSFFPIGCPAVLHGHQLVEAGGPPTVYVLRDGRDAMVSLYFYLRRAIPGRDLTAAPRRLRHRFPGATDLDDIRTNLPGFIERQCTRPTGTRHTWAEHAHSVRASGRSDVPILRYEDLRRDCTAALGEALTVLLGEPADLDRVRESVDRFSFARQSGRQPGKEDATAFVRKGATGEWAEHFTPAAAETFDRYCGDALIELGYEDDRSWIDRLTQSPVDPSPTTAGETA